MRSRPSLLLMRNLRSLAVVVLATLPCVAFAQWRVVAVSTEVDKMRFNTIIDAHSFMKNYRSGEEQGKGTPVGDALYPVASYGDGRYVSRICFKYLGATGDYDPTTCTGDPATVYWRSTYVLPGEMDKTPFLDRDLGLPTTTMCVGNPIHLGTGN
ncbi:type IV secretion protein Rhs, partial [Salmonella enterica subsp. enterica serovar Typhimurium]|nr:type IV secretion protein Rhs [Salmonella enterica subsp. enterica serovar Typhimurium]